MTITATQPRAPRARLATPGRFLVRVGGLPLAAAESLAFPDTAAWAARLIEAEEDLRGRGVRIADRLAVTIGSLPDPAEGRARLIKLRRDVFNGRPPRDPAAARAVLAEAAPEVLADYEDWLAAREAHDERLAAGPAVFEAELRTRQAALRALATTVELRHGLLLSSRVLDRQLPGYLDRSGDRLDKRGRRMERSLVEYAYRASTKTSPFATFTTVCGGEFAGEGAGGLLRLHRDGPGRHHHVRLNMAALVRLAGVVLGRDDLRAELPVRLVTGLRPGAERTSYLRRRQVAVGASGPVELDLVQENLFHLPSSPVLHELTELLAGGRTRPLREVAAALVAADPDDRAPRDVEEYLHHLIRLGVLVAPSLRVDIHDPDPLARFRAGVRALGRPWAETLADRLDTVDGHLAAYPGGDLDDRRRLLDAVGDELAAAHADLDRPEVSPPGTLVYEDVALPGRVLADRGAWAGMVGDLARVATILPVFDISIARRLVTKGYFRARYGAGGRCDDLLTFAHEYRDDFFDHFVRTQMRRRPFDADNRYVRQANTFHLSEVDALDDARELAARLVNEAYRALPAGAEELVLDDDFVDRVAERVPGTLGPVEAHGFFVQVARRPTPLAVVNRGFTGPALMLSRFEDCLTGAGAGLLEHALTAAQPDGVVLAELKGGYEASNLNLHPAVTPYELVCPGDISTRPAAQQIPIDDLVLHDDPDQDRLVLRSARLGVEVVPVYLGFLLPLALPEVQQVLLTFSPTGLAAMDLWAGTDVPLPGEGIVAYPRIRYRDAVLQRRMWKAHPACLPAPAGDADGSAVVLEWARWRRQHGLPRRVFATLDGAGGRVVKAAAETAGGPGIGANKPLYVDFDSYFSVNLLASVARAAGRRLVFTEMLPDHHEQALTENGSAHVSELILAFNAAHDAAREER
ncbi:lantibiotic dehydratase [Dactylosporangium sp. CA-092794]|uniref:lantibiotic dehydratase n=1 Tax=Dactylosporangium sp. CA-092794 TaxID=3239929 RepID=UPI003D90C53C